MKREEVKQLVEQGIRELNEALASGKSDRLQQYLDVMARFPRYSFNNSLLVAIQFPSATMVQGFQAWKKMGRSVMKGSKGIAIIAPVVFRKIDERDDRQSNRNPKATKKDDEQVLAGFKVVHVFDVSQTEGKDLPEFAKVTGDPGRNIEAVERLIRSQGIELRYETICGGADGLSKNGTIVIDTHLEPGQALMTLVHEYAHEALHWQPERRNETTKTIRETEAEAVAHVVCRALGLHSLEYSADYIQLYNGDSNVLAKSLDHIQKTSAQILEGIRQHLLTGDAKSKEVAA